MDEPIRDDVRVALCETNPTLRSAFQTALFRRGVRDLQVCKDTSALLTLLDREIVDLVVSAVDLPGVDFCELVQQVRQQTVGRNPFTLVLATISEATIGDIRRVINAGVDRVARKPMSMSDMLAYINAMAGGRKPFAATQSYIGPSRRAANRKGPEMLEVMEVPNTLKAKIRDKMPPDELEKLIGRGMSTLRHFQARNACVTLWRLAQKLAEHYRDGAAPDVIATETARIIAKCQEVELRYRGTSDNAVAQVAASLEALVERVAWPDARHSLPIILELMRKLGEVLNRATQIGPESAMTVMEIAQTVRSYASGERDPSLRSG